MVEIKIETTAYIHNVKSEFMDIIDNYAHSKGQDSSTITTQDLNNMASDCIENDELYDIVNNIGETIAQYPEMDIVFIYKEF